jgi:hypothetical protein
MWIHFSRSFLQYEGTNVETLSILNKLAGLDVVYLMRRRAQGPTTLSRMVTDCGAPVKLKSDNAPEFKSKKWMLYLESMSIKPEFTEAHHPNENLAERRGGAIKAAVVHLLRVTGCPIEFWCYALEYVSLLRTVLTRRSLNWSTPPENHWGEQPTCSQANSRATDHYTSGHRG